MQHQEGADRQNKTSNEKGGSNEGHNKNRNGSRTDKRSNRYITEKFKGKIEGLLNLGLKEDKHTDSLMVFQKEIHTYVLDNYKQPIEINYLVNKFKGPLPRLTKQITTIYKLKKEGDIDPNSSGTELTEDENSMVNNSQELLGTDRKRFVERKSALEHNISKLYGLVWGK